MQINTRFEIQNPNKNQSIQVSGARFKFHGGGFCMDDSRAKVPDVVVKNTRPKGKGYQSRHKTSGFRASPDGMGWFTSKGKRINLVWPEKGIDSPISMVLNAALHKCPPVPDQYYSDLLLSDGVYFWLQKFQLERHLQWCLRTKYRINVATRVSLVKRGVEAFIRKVSAERGVNIGGSLDVAYTEADLLLLDVDERVRDFVRRYGRDTRRSNR